MPKKQKPCSIEGCPRKSHAYTYCDKHYRHFTLYGDPLGGSFNGKPTQCSVENCPAPPKGKGFCDRHYRRWKKDGHPGELEYRRKLDGGWIDNNGYHLVTQTKNKVKRSVRVHRLIMEAHLGRELFDHENVHHINGDRSDNRLENLELWSTSQPCGQRVEDKIAWAKEILSQYPDQDSTQTYIIEHEVTLLDMNGEMSTQ